MSAISSDPSSLSIVVAMASLRSHYHASFVLARALRRGGHRVIYACTPSFAKMAAVRGFEHKVFHPDRFRRVPPDGLGLLSRRRFNGRMRFLAAQQLADEVGEWLACVSPDLVLLDCELTQYAEPLLAQRIPFIYVSPNLTWVRSWSLPPVTSGIIPDPRGGLLTRVRVGAAWANVAVRLFCGHLLSALLLRLYFGPSRYCTIGRRLTRHGGRLYRFEYQHRLKNVPTLVTAPRELEFPGFRPSAHRHYVGSCVDLERYDAPFDCLSLDRDKPLVYFSIGTLRSARDAHIRRLMHAVVDAVVTRRPGWQLVVQCGGHLAADEFSSLPPNVFVAKQVPQLEILSRAAVLVSLGGFGTIREAIYFGIPMLLFPYRADAKGDAARVAFHRLGLRGDIRTVNAQIVDDMIARVMGNGRIRDALARMRRLFLEQNDGRAAVDIVERVIAHV